MTNLGGGAQGKVPVASSAMMVELGVHSQKHVCREDRPAKKDTSKVLRREPSGVI